MTYSVSLNAHAARSFRKLPREIQKRISPAIDAVKDEPRPPGAEKITGIANTYRIRVGNYRVLYEIHDNVLVILVIDLGHRREIYR